MNVKSRHLVFSGILLVALLATVTACSLGSNGATPTSGPTGGPTGGPGGGPQNTAPGIPVTHVDLPGDPPAAVSRIQDPSDAALASQHRVNAGEDFSFDLFERPFDQSMQTYAPQLDIAQAGLSHDATWMYVTIALAGKDPQAGGLPGVYGVEMDVNQDDRGDFLVVVTAPTSTSWSSDGVQVFQDANHDVGSIHPVQSDAPSQKIDGYETVLDNGGQGKDPDLAFARLSPTDPNSVQLAYKWSLVQNSGFLWGAWAIDAKMFQPAWFDYNDHFTQADAGSPVFELKQFYPLKDLYLMDNTCRWGSGFVPQANIPGVCPVPATPTPPPHAPAKPGPTPTNTQIIIK